MDLFVETVPGLNCFYFLHYRRTCDTASYYEIEMAIWDRILYVSVELTPTPSRNYESEQARHSADSLETPDDSR